MVGLFAERLPAGFAFSDTAFRIFILMASRRLNSDRFLTRDYWPEVYTREGMDWIADNTMLTVLLRHYPELRPALRGLDNAFAPWSRIA
jgi:Animal haem peroxidase